MTKKTIIIPLLFVAIAAMAETALIIKPLTGSEHTAALSAIGYVKMTQDSLFVYSHGDFMLGKGAFKDIRHIRYGEQTDTPTGDADGSSAITTCCVYPNPTHDMLVISNADADQAHIFNLNGHLLQTVSISSGNATVKVNTLPEGEYLLLINTQTYKFIKH